MENIIGLSRRRTQYIPGLDGLRAIAVLMVLFYHLKLPFAKGGLLGVTVFFAISGFLITRILATEIEKTNRIDLGDFWFRRIRRIYPAILAMLAPLILISAVFNRVLFTKACSDSLSVIFGYNNWWQIFNNVSYFENAGAPSPLTHCWSLAIETQFYLVFPLILLVLSRFRNKKKISALVTLALAVVSMALMWIMFDPTKDPSRVYYGTDTRIFSLLLGAFLAIITVNVDIGRKTSSLLCDVIGFASLIGLLCMMFFVDGYSSFLYHGGQALTTILSVLVIFSTMNTNGVLGRILGLAPLKWLGDRSYGLYLWHFPVILLISKGKQSAWWINLIEIALAVLLSALSYHFIETPIRHGAIGKSLSNLRHRPMSRSERKNHTKLLNKCIITIMSVVLVAVCVVMCVAFVPREKSVSNIAKLEAQAQAAGKQTDQKAGQIKDNANQSASKYKTADELLSNIQLLLIGDSISLGANDRFYEVFPKSISDASVSRFPSESIDIFDSYVKDKKWDGDGIIFALGSNGVLYDSLEQLRSMLKADKPLFIVTARAPYTSWVEDNNDEIRQFVKKNKNTYLVDWYAASENHPEYFDEDDTHLVIEGREAFVDCIKKAVLQAYKLDTNTKEKP